MNNEKKNPVLTALESTNTGTWDWNLITGQIIYSQQWAEIHGYTVSELPQTEETWQNIVHPEDLSTIKEKLNLYLQGKTPSFNLEFRAIRKDGKEIWINDRVIILDCDDKNIPHRIVGITQDISQLKTSEINLHANQAKLNMIMDIVSLATWEWDVIKGHVEYNQEYLNMLGYSTDKITGSLLEWSSMSHAGDLQTVKDEIIDYAKKNTGTYKGEVRLKHKDGTYIWTRIICSILERDKNDKPIRIIGAHLNIEDLKRSQKSLTEVKEHNTSLESKLISQIQTLVEQDNDLWQIHEIAEILLTADSDTDFENRVYDCLKILGKAINQNRTYIWKNVVDKDGVECCLQIHEWLRDFTPDQKPLEHIQTPYTSWPTVKKYLDEDKCLNSFSKDLMPCEQDILDGQGVKTVLVAPINIKGKNWGFMGIDNHETYVLFSPFEEKIILMSGVLIANAIEKNENLKALREAEERNSLTLNTMPISYSCWTKDLKQIACNDEAFRLLGLSSQQEYLDRFSELCPEYQPNGQLSSVMAPKKIKKAFETGYERFEWMRKALNGNLIPVEIILVRVKYKNDYVVESYTRDLRETKEMEELTRLTLNAMPLSYSCWTRDMKHIACNDEAVRLLGLSSQQEYLDRFSELCPEYQPNGQLSSVMAPEKILKAFETGNERFEWLYKTQKEEIIPTEITLVRVKYKDDYIIEGYARDLRETKEIEELTRLTLNAMPLSYSCWTSDIRHIACNDEAVRLLGLSSQQEYLDRFEDLSPEHQTNGKLSSVMALEKIKKAFKTGYERFEWLYKTLKDEIIPVEVILVRVKHRDDYILESYARDLRETKTIMAAMQKIEADLRVAHEEVLMSSKAKTNFLANMSHEIRTPLNAISGLTEIILRESTGRRTADHAYEIKNACANLVNIINDILDISKIESGKLEITNAEYNLSSLINDTINISRVRLGTKPLIFTANIDSKLPSILYGDEIRLKQILINFLTNAIKYTHAGNIHLQVNGTFAKTKAILQFSVTDTGSGIKKNDLKRLFAQFERVDTRKNRNIEGTGLGLAIAKRLAEMMEGKIEIESTVGEGSTFSVIIPQTYLTYVPVTQIDVPKNILLYEPREIYARSITESIQNLGSDCEVCINQSELYECIYSKEYDFVFVTNINAKKVKQLLKTKKSTAKIVVLANFGEMTLEADVYTLFLPITCLSIADILQNDITPSFYGENKTDSIQFIATEAKILIVDDNSVNLKVAAGLMQPYQFQIDTVMSGYDAIEKIKTNKYDIVFMDHMMPEMDGIDTTIAIRAMDNEYYKKLPIIALTANAIVGSKEMFLNEGMNDFLAKPIEISKLTGILSKWIPHDKKKVLPKINKTEPVRYTIRIDGIDILSGIAAVGGNAENYLQILSVYYTEGLIKCALLQKLFAANDIQGFKIEVHALKSSSATIGAANIAAIARRLEDAAASNNIPYITSQIDVFISNFENLLANIKPSINKYAEEKDSKNELKEKGSTEYLQSQLQKLSDAIEFISISEIEIILDALFTFEWSEKTITELKKIHDAITYFDYDKALLVVKFLQEN